MPSGRQAVRRLRASRTGRLRRSVIRFFYLDSLYGVKLPRRFLHWESSADPDGLKLVTGRLRSEVDRNGEKIHLLSLRWIPAVEEP
jgi:hypothetical protein